MVLIDSCGWLEYFTDGPLAGEYAALIESEPRPLVPVIVLYEVYKFLRRTHGEEMALVVAAQLHKGEVVGLDAPLVMEAADFSLDHGLAMADA